MSNIGYFQCIVDSYASGWWICYPDGEKLFGPYKRAQDAKGQLTLIRKQYVEKGCYRKQIKDG